MSGRWPVRFGRTVLAFVYLAGCEFSPSHSRNVDPLDSDQAKEIVTDTGSAVLADDPIELVDAIELADGRVVVLEAAANALLVYGRSGNVQQRMGGTGDGPGEFRRPRRVASYAKDSVAVLDVEQLRIHIFSLETRRVSRSIPIGLGTADVDLAGVLADGSFVIIGRSVERAVDAWQETVTVFRIPANGQPGRAILRTPGVQYFNIRFEGRAAMGAVPFAGSPIVAAAGCSVAIVHPRACRVEIYDPTGSVRTAIQSDCARVPISTADMALYVASRTERMRIPSQRQRTERLFRSGRVPIPATLPFIRDLRFDTKGRLWVEVYPEAEARQSEWHIFSENGQSLGRLRLARELRVHWIGSDRLLASAADRFGRKHLRVFRFGESPQRMNSVK